MQDSYSVSLNLFIVIASTMCFLAGCSGTEGNLRITGKVYDDGTKTGIPRKNIIIQGLVFSNNKSDSIEVGQFSTDSAGSFTYSFRKIKGVRDYNFCFVGDSEYLFTAKKMKLFDLEKNADFLFFSLNKLVDLTINLNRKSKSPACDTLRLSWESNGVYGGFLYPYKIYNYGNSNNRFGVASGSDLIWIGGSVNSSITTKVFAGKRTELSWELYRNGKRMEFTDTIICKSDFANTVNFTY